MPFCHDENHVQTSVFFGWTFKCEKLPITRAYSKISKGAEKTLKKKGPLYKTFSTCLFFTHLLTAKSCLETKLSLYQESFVSQESTRQVDRNVLWAVWYSDPCLNFTVKAALEADLSFLWFRRNRQSYICLNLCGSFAAHKRKFTIIPNYSLHMLDLLQVFSPECCQLCG